MVDETHVTGHIIYLSILHIIVQIFLSVYAIYGYRIVGIHCEKISLQIKQFLLYLNILSTTRYMERQMDPIALIFARSQNSQNYTAYICTCLIKFKV